MNEMIEKVKPKKTKKSLIINLSIFMILGIISGLLMGFYKIANQTDPNLYNVDINNLYDNVLELKASLGKKTPIDMGATKSCVIALDNTYNHKNLKMIGLGNVKAMGVTQSINTCAIRLGDDIFSENISSGIVDAADRFYLKGKTINHHKGSVSDEAVSWETNPEQWTTDTYLEKMGGKINEYMLYIISSKTVKDESKVELTEEGNYKFSLTLDKINAVVKYVKSMKTTGGLTEFPEFKEDLKLTIVIDADFRLLEVSIHERYVAKKKGIPIPADSVGQLTLKFEYDGDFKMPSPSDETIL